MGMLGVTMPRMYQILVTNQLNFLLNELNHFKMSVKPKVANGLYVRWVRGRVPIYIALVVTH